MSIPTDSISTAERSADRGRIVLGVISLLAGVLGWWASLRLFLDYTESLKDTNFVPSCNLSAVVSCAQNYGSSYGSIFGFSNTVIGLSLFLIPMLMGVLYLANVRLPRWIQVGYSIGTFGAIVLISYLQWASFTQIGTLCLYCLLIWSVTIPLFWAVLGRTLAKADPEDRAPRASFLGGLSRAVSGNWWLFALVHLAAVLAFGELSIGALSGLIGALTQ